jgi:NAD(P)-dependent dehydrogenase (short-subunit alcohol dehydrogenase family)
MIIFDANPDTGIPAAAELHQATGGRIPVEFFAIDVRDSGAIDKALAAVVEKYGAPDVLINSAGIAE